MQLRSFDVADPTSFVARHGIDLTCTHCGGRNDKCDHCGGMGWVALRGNRVYDSGFPVVKRLPRCPVPGVVVFEHEGNVWFGASTPDREVDMMPQLALAWTKVFPRCGWFPDQFIDTRNLELYEQKLGRAVARSLLARLEKSLAKRTEMIEEDLANVRDFLQRR